MSGACERADAAGQVRLARIPLLESKGPCYARYVGAQLYRGETFYLQLDSHMTMVPRWCAHACDQPICRGPTSLPFMQLVVYLRGCYSQPAVLPKAAFCQLLLSRGPQQT